jgi:prepilin-type N-terminal cleavage/methylation domain-containing protein
MPLYPRAFTLIELLVVIAIIGILSSVVLASLNTARDKGANAAVRADLTSIRAQAEIVYDTAGGSYDNGTLSVCADATIVKQLQAAKSASGGTSYTCNDTAGAWAAAVPLKGGGAFCVDSTGAAKSAQGTGTTAYAGVTGIGSTYAITTGNTVCN